MKQKNKENIDKEKSEIEELEELNDMLLPMMVCSILLIVGFLSIVVILKYIILKISKIC